MIAHRILLASAIALGLAASSAQAATVVVHGMDPTDVASTWLLQNGPSEDPRFVSIDEVFPPSQTVVPLGDATVSGCEGERQPASALEAANEVVIDDFTNMEYLAAAASVERNQELLPCLNGAPRVEVLAQHHFLRGIVAYEAEGPQAAVERFEEALLVSPFLQWNELYPPTVRPSFEEAVKSAISAERAFITMSAEILEEGTLWLDGLAVDSRTRTSTLYAGTHLVQWKPTDGELLSWSVEAGPGQSLTLVHRRDAVRELLTGRAGAEVTTFARDRVLAPVERAGGSLIVAQEDEIVLFHRYSQEEGRWRLADVRDLLEYRREGQRMRTAGQAMTIGGAILGLVGGGLAIGGAVSQDTIRSQIEIALDESHPEYEGVVAEDVEAVGGPQAYFRAWGGPYRTAQSIEQAGSVLSIVGGGFTIAGIPLQIIGSKRAKAHGVGKRGKGKKGKGKKGQGTKTP